jgi:Mg2+ and Co2+ transporter CorA
MGIMLSMATLVVRVFGMNITIPLHDAANTAVFWQTTGDIIGTGAAIYLVAALLPRSGIL